MNCLTKYRDVYLLPGLIDGRLTVSSKLEAPTLLTNFKVQNAKPRSKPYKLADHGGLYLSVSTTGAKSWRYDYRLHGKRETLTVGQYPRFSLAEARIAHADAQRERSKGRSPARAKQSHKYAGGDTFQNVAAEWFTTLAPHRGSSWCESVNRWLTKELYPAIGHMPIRSITPADILSIMRRLDSAGHPNTANMARQTASRVFTHAIRNLRSEFDPAQSVRGAIMTPKVRHHAPLPAKDIPAFVAALGAYQGTLQTGLGIKVLLLAFVRKRELTQATWGEVDFERAEWRIPSERMKMGEAHIVPLSRQALECFRELKRAACGSQYVLPNHGSPNKPMGTSTFNAAFNRMGYAGFAPHGLRATASTILNEQGFKPDVIERQLAHAERNKVRAAYNRSEYLDERRAMMQAWADYVDGLCCGGNVVAIRA